MPGARRSTCGGAEGGFTLLEALVALALLGTAVIGMIAAIRAGVRAQAGVDAQITAVALAEARVSELDALPRDSLQAFGAVRRGVFAPPFSAFAWEARVGPVAGAAAAGLLALEVRVTWAEGASEGAYTLSTLVYRPDPLPRALRRGP
ncbi:MAG TPA: hypothetical protein VF158_16505 [Longimicrobiales bacterium]